MDHCCAGYVNVNNQINYGVVEMLGYMFRGIVKMLGELAKPPTKPKRQVHAAMCSSVCCGGSALRRMGAHKLFS